MRKFLKENKLCIILLLLLCIAIVIQALTIKIDYENSFVRRANFLEEMKNYPNSPLKGKDPYMMDTYTLFSNILVDRTTSLIQFIFPLVIMLCGCYNFYHKISSGYLKNKMMRENYKKCIIKEILNSWKYALMVPIFLVFTFLVCYLVSGHFDIYKTIEYYGYSLIGRKYLGNLILYFIVYFINLTIMGIYYINIFLYYSKKKMNIPLTLILSYITMIIVDIFFEVIIGDGFTVLFPQVVGPNFRNSFSIFNFWVYENVVSLSFMTGYALLLAFISTLLVAKTYKNKEDVNIAMEK